MNKLIEQRVKEAKELLVTVQNAAMATVNEDGSPHNTPFHFQIDKARQYIYWASSPESLHSQNLVRTGQAFVVIYIPGTGDGLYMRAQNAHELSGNELEEGLRLRNEQRKEAGRQPIGIDRYTGATAQRMYRAELAQYWVNLSEKDKAGNITNDYRHEIAREDLI